MPKRNRENKKAKSKGHGIVFTRALLVFRTRLARGIPLDARFSRGIPLGAQLACGIPLDARLCARHSA